MIKNHLDTNGHKTPSEEIRERMSTLREGMLSDTAEITHDLKQATKPSHYLEKFPLASIAVAAGIGYMLVPTKPKIVQPSEEQLASLAEKGKLPLNHSNDQQPSLAKRAVLAVGAMAARAALAYVGQKIGDRAVPESNSDDPAYVDSPASSL